MSSFGGRFPACNPYDACKPALCCAAAQPDAACLPAPWPACADAVALKARNKEGPPLFNEVSAELIPQSASKVKVRGRQA